MISVTFWYQGSFEIQRRAIEQLQLFQSYVDSLSFLVLLHSRPRARKIKLDRCVTPHTTALSSQRGLELTTPFTVHQLVCLCEKKPECRQSNFLCSRFQLLHTLGQIQLVEREVVLSGWWELCFNPVVHAWMPDGSERAVHECDSVCAQSWWLGCLSFNRSHLHLMLYDFPDLVVVMVIACCMSYCSWG